MASGSDSQLVLVTGATGYVAPHIIQLLLEEGYTVRGTMRDLQDEKKVKILRDLFPDEAKFSLVQADLTKDEGWNEVVQGCRYVLHVASPFPIIMPSDENDLLKPAVEGTKRVLTACSESGSVKRVVLTSSLAAVHGDLLFEEGKVYTEEDWSNTENASMIEAYSKSKTLAEKAAWDFVKELPAEKKFEMATVNPGMILGPILANNYATSIEILKRLLERSVPMIARLNFTVCDVRDVAKAHLKAMTLEEAAGQRHIVATQGVWLKELALLLSKEFKSQGYSVPTMVAPYVALWLNTFIDKSLKIILPRVGREYKYDNKRMKEVLGVEPIELNKTVLDTAYSLIEKGFVKKSKKYKQGKKEGEQPATEAMSAAAEANGDKKKSEAPDSDEKKEVEPKMKELEPEDKEKATPLSQPANQQQEIALAD